MNKAHMNILVRSLERQRLIQIRMVNQKEEVEASQQILRELEGNC